MDHSSLELKLSDEDLEYGRDISGAVGTSELLAQLAEESAELSQAALKLRRAIGYKNPTPVSPEVAINNLIEEFGDILVCASLLLSHQDLEKAMLSFHKKMKRWRERIVNV